MPHPSSISRYSLIVKKLQANQYTPIEELISYLGHQLEHLQNIDDTLKMGISKRTLQRDFKQIRTHLGLDIEYSKKEKGYFITKTVAENQNFQRMMEAFDIYNSLNMAQDMMPFMHLEKRRPQGTENLMGLLHAIQHKKKIIFIYQKFWEDISTRRIIEPYALKEFKNRWYVLGRETRDGDVKSFALDRLTNLEISRKSFEFHMSYNIEEDFKYAFGIISPKNQKPVDIVLSFDPVQGKYIKSLPLHSSQRIIADTQDELQIGLKLCLTEDFIMELLSYGDRMQVLKPKALMEEVKMAHKRAFELYM